MINRCLAFSFLAFRYVPNTLMIYALIFIRSFLFSTSHLCNSLFSDFLVSNIPSHSVLRYILVCVNRLTMFEYHVEIKKSEYELSQSLLDRSKHSLNDTRYTSIIVWSCLLIILTLPLNNTSIALIYYLTHS